MAWVFDIISKDGTVTLTITDGRNTLDSIQHSTLGYDHKCTAEEFAAAISKAVLYTFDIMQIPDTSDVCESEW